MLRMAPAPVANIAATISCGVAVQDFLVKTGRVDSHSVASPNNRRCVDDEDERLVATLAYEGPDTVVAVVDIDPLEAFITVVKFVVSGLVRIESIKMLDKAAQPVVHRTLREMPIQTRIVVPFLPLAKLYSLEDKLFAGMRPHPRKEHPDIGELLPRIARHFLK